MRRTVLITVAMLCSVVFSVCAQSVAKITSIEGVVQVLKRA